MKMIHHQVLNGMEITIVVHMMLYLLFCSTYKQQNPKNGKTIFQESNQYLSTLHDGFQKYSRGVSILEAAHDSVQTLLDIQAVVYMHCPHKCFILYSKYHNCNSNALIATIQL